MAGSPQVGGWGEVGRGYSGAPMLRGAREPVAYPAYTRKPL